ncbi:MAG: alpha-N-arabinofuranosidase [Ruminococcus sp.]|nr:alpha-N-arabinofuranosidase [Ruminococcus sp.]
MKQAQLKIDREKKLSKVSKNIYGHFSEHLGRCIYDGIYVGEDSKIKNINGMRSDVVDALKEIGTPVLRWPGGCFADEYHWKDGIGEKSKRRKMINTNWGGTVEDNSFGTHEFFELCEQIGCEPYIAGNMGSGTVQEMSEWIEYMTFDGESDIANLRRKNGRDKAWKLKYFGIGNESWGCGGSMSPEYYSDVYRQYQSFCKNLSGNQIYKVACGPNADDYNWTDKIMSRLDPNWHLNAISLHYYTIPTGDWGKKGSATEFSDAEYYSTISKTLYMDELITKHSEIMKKYDPNGRVKLFVDEWGIWCDVEEGTNPGFLYQQNSMRDAIIAAINLNIFNQHSDVVGMANIAQVVNVLQSVVLTDGEQMVKTPTFYVFKMFKPHHDATLISSEISNVSTGDNQNEMPALSCSVTESEGGIFATISNCSLNDDITLTINQGNVASAQIITAGSARSYNDFGEDEKVTLKDYADFRCDGDSTEIIIPRCSVVSVKLQ